MTVRSALLPRLVAVFIAASLCGSALPQPRVLLMRQRRWVADGPHAERADGRHGDRPREFLQRGR